jgi:exodeoxyribonuclease VII large subunit
VGFITSPTGAAVQDFVRILLRRNWRGRLVVLPAKVQGPGAAQEMVEQLRVARDAGIFDLLVIGRGGGSMEDLWSFNEEPLVRAVAACEIPIISAVGHEIDFTLCDFAADFRAETPSAAAELISSHFLASVEKLGGLIDSMERVLENFAETSRARLEHAESRLRLLSPDKQIEHGFLRIDDLGNRLVSVLRQTADVKRRDLVQALHRFERVSPQSRVEKESHRLLSLWKRLQSASPKSVLNRGFVILRDETGKPLTKSSQAKPGKRLRGQFADGEVPLKVDADPGKSA